MAKKPTSNKTAETVFPYLTSILSGRMTPEFVADQAEAAFTALWDKTEKAGDEPAAEN